jgi:predicted PurR-regulated permease PerM
MSTPGAEVLTEAPGPQPGPTLAAAPSASEPAAATVGVARATGVLAVLAVLTAVYIASSLLLPILVGALVALLLNPPVRWLSQRWLPRWLAALLVLAATLGVVVAAAVTLYEPALKAAQQSPVTAQTLKRKADFFMRSFQPAGAFGEAMETIEEFGGESAERTVAVVEEASGFGKRLGGVLTAAATAVTITMLVFLFLVYGEALFRRVVTISPTLSDKRNTVSIVRGVQSEVSRYVGTITLINVGLGAAVALTLFLLGVEDPLLWGGAAAVLNFAPYVGPFFGFLMLLAVGVLQFDTPWLAAAPALAFLVLNIIESQVVTPVVLGRQFSVNPVVILVWLLFWGWLWGLPGVLLAMPLLVCGKLICQRSDNLRPWAQILET